MTDERQEQAEEQILGDDAQQPAESKTETLNDLEAMRNEAQDFKEKYLRSLAEMENGRKRMERERMDIGRFAMRNLVLDLLQPLDHMEKALDSTGHMSDEVKNWAYGFQMILGQFKEGLANHGIVPFTATEGQFDPHHHEAIETVETEEVPEGTILKQMLCGWRMGEKTLRPAHVQVATAPRPQEEDTLEESKEEQQPKE